MNYVFKIFSLAKIRSPFLFCVIAGVPAFQRMSNCIRRLDCTGHLDKNFWTFTEHNPIRHFQQNTTPK